MNNGFKNREWYGFTIGACIAVTLYVALTHLGTIGSVCSTFIGYFSSVILGCVLAYLMNPLANLLQKKVFKIFKNENLKWTISVIISVIAMILFLAFMLGTLIPQLIDSIGTLFSNMDTYLDSLNKLAESIGLSSLNLDSSTDSESTGLASLLNLSSITAYLMENANHIVKSGAAAGKTVANWVIAFILAVYMLMAKSSLKTEAARLLRAILPGSYYKRVKNFLIRCDRILVQYIVYSLLDAVIVGVVNAVFMKIAGMQYIGLVSMVVAVTNLVPTFGPIIGGAIGGFILLLVKPMHALIFIAFTVVLQFFDGYIIKPKLFGNTLGVSGLLILAAVIVCGKMFGVVGILLAIPIAAILDFIYTEELLPALEKRRRMKEKAPAKNLHTEK